MKLKPYLESGLVELSEEKQAIFIEALQDEETNKFVKLGIERALTMLGYEVVEGEE